MWSEDNKSILELLSSSLSFEKWNSSETAKRVNEAVEELFQTYLNIPEIEIKLYYLFDSINNNKCYQESELLHRVESNMREYELFYWLLEEISINRSWSLAGSCNSLD